MGKFLVGLLIGIAAGGGGVYVVLTRTPTVTAEIQPDAASVRGTKSKKPRRRKRNGQPQDITLTAAESRVTSKGPALRVATRSFDMAEGAPETRDLSQSEIDATFSQKSAALVTCIQSARGLAPVSGRITMSVLVAADGSVAKARVKAPNYLLTHGLYACANSQLRALSFPRTGKETVVSVPFNIE